MNILMFLSRLPEKYAMAGRNAQVARIYTILDLLEGAPHGLTVAELWDRVKDRGHEVSRRTVYRDLEALNDAGFPLFSEGADESARWKLERDARVAQYLVLSARELFALYLARESLMSLKGTVFYQDLVTAFGKIEGKLGAKGREYLEELSREVRVDSLPRWNFGLSAELVDTVRAAAAEGHVMEVTYRSAHTGGSERRRRLGGQFVYLAKGGVYLVAEDLESHEVKVFALARMRDAVMTAEPYGGVAVDPERFFGDSMGVFRGGAAEKVTLVFSPPVAASVAEREWHASQKVETLRDGKVRVELQVALTPELLQWVLGYGAAVEVVGPGELRLQVVEAAKRVVEAYSRKRVA